MLYLRRVVGQSMLPTLRPGQICLFVKTRSYEHGDIVLAHADEKRPVVKRMHVLGDEVHLRGDNHLASHTYIITARMHKHRIVAKLVWPRADGLEVL